MTANHQNNVGVHFEMFRDKNEVGLILSSRNPDVCTVVLSTFDD